MSHIFVFGSTGFIGKALVSKLKALSYEFSTAGLRNSDIPLELGKDHSTLLNVVNPNDIVVFLAAISSPDICNNQHDHAWFVNVSATSSLISSLTSKGVRVIFASTDLVFGSAITVVNEKSAVSPFGVYGKMKAEVECLFMNHPLVKIIRFSFVMGPGDKYTSMLLESAIEGRKIDIYDGFERNVVALSDVTDGICNLIVHWDRIATGVINFSGPDCISKWDLTLAFSNKFCPGLNSSLVDAPDGFWCSRPKRIEMKSTYFFDLLQRTPKSVCENLLTWCN